MLYILVIFIGFFIVLEMPGLLKKQAYTDLIIVALLLMFSASYGINYHFKSNILPNPNRILYASQPLADSFQSVMQIGDEVKP